MQINAHSYLFTAALKCLLLAPQSLLSYDMYTRENELYQYHQNKLLSSLIQYWHVIAS